MAAAAGGRPRTSQGATPGVPRHLPDPPRRILLASPGTPFEPEVIRCCVELATPEQAKITIVSIAKVWGTSLGLPHPGLQPTPRELEEQRRIVNRAAKVLKGKGFEVRVQIVRSRNPAKMIARWAQAKYAHAIVVADPERPRWRRLIEGDLAAEIERRSGIPVHAVPTPASGGRGRAV